MIFTIKNQAVGTRSYLGGLVTVEENEQTTIDSSLNTLLIGDDQFLFDIGSAGTIRVILNNGIKDLNPGEALSLSKTLLTFSTDPVATMPIYNMAAVKVSQSDTTGSGATVWAMRNDANSIKQIVIERIFLMAAFGAATPVDASSLVYEICRFSGATPSGGAPICVIQADNSGSATSVTDARVLDTGLVTSGVSFENAFVYVPISSVMGASAAYIRSEMAFKLAPGEGLAIRLSTDAIVGQSLHGEIVWSER